MNNKKKKLTCDFCGKIMVKDKKGNYFCPDRDYWNIYEEENKRKDTK